MRTLEVELNASGLRFGIIAARWNSIYIEKLIEGAVDALKQHGAEEEDITLVRVPGSFELPLAVQEVARSGNVDAVICLGVLIRGETLHYDLIAREVTAGLSRVMLETGIPVAHGVLAVENAEQAKARSAVKANNRGFEVAQAAIEMAQVIRELRATKS